MPRLGPGPKDLDRFLGIDPGRSGAICVMGRNGPEYIELSNTDHDVWSFVRDQKPSFGIIEKVNAFPGQGVASMFNFGCNFGFCRGLLVAAGIPFEEVHPRIWIRGLGIGPRKKDEGRTQWKSRLRARAQQLFPGIEITLKTSDAILIAEYCRRKHTGTL